MKKGVKRMSKPLDKNKPLIQGFRNETVIQPLSKIQSDLEGLNKFTSEMFNRNRQELQGILNFIINETKEIKAQILALDVKSEAVQMLLNLPDDKIKEQMDLIMNRREKDLEDSEDLRLKRKSVDRESKDGDFVKIDFKGKLEGEDKVFDGGEGRNVHVELGTKKFLEDFEKQLVGVKSGDSKKVELTFPLNYQRQDLAGKKVIFDVLVHSVKEKE